MNPTPLYIAAFFAGAYFGFRLGKQVLLEELVEAGYLVEIPDFIEDQREAAQLGWQ